MALEDKPNIQHSTVTSLPAGSGAQDPCFAQLLHNIAPLGLEIDCQTLWHWSQLHHFETFAYTNLIQESKTWAPKFSQKPLTQLSLHFPFLIMDAPAVTELVYTIGHCFKMVRGQQVNHSVTLRLEEASNTNLGLLRGLHFTHICLHCSAGREPSEIVRLVQLVREFRFSHISLSLVPSVNVEEFVETLTALMRQARPEAIRFTQQPQALIKLGCDRTAQLLLENGYYLHNHHSLERFDAANYRPMADVLRLGPGACSHIAGYVITNLSEPQDYLNHLENGQIPNANTRKGEFF